MPAILCISRNSRDGGDLTTEPCTLAILVHSKASNVATACPAKHDDNRKDVGGPFVASLSCWGCKAARLKRGMSWGVPSWARQEGLEARSF